MQSFKVVSICYLFIIKLRVFSFVLFCFSFSFLLFSISIVKRDLQFSSRSKSTENGQTKHVASKIQTDKSNTSYTSYTKRGRKEKPPIPVILFFSFGTRRRYYHSLLKQIYTDTHTQGVCVCVSITRNENGTRRRRRKKRERT